MSNLIPYIFFVIWLVVFGYLTHRFSYDPVKQLVVIVFAMLVILAFVAGALAWLARGG